MSDHNREDVAISWSEESKEELSDLQQEILVTSRLNPEMNATDIASETGASESWVRKTLNEYEDDLEMEKETSSSGGSALGSLIMLPFKLIAVTFKFALWLVALPFKILAKILG
ncbi:hypothetical protein [Halobellus ordinarius]|uniref:hypothetical protein n=1 Tax=Halobellus ordinarius TaxID=3075120 RepID=UPI0028803D67|nr:hypothetical protein [Halobellus sp. ZY16]